LPPPHGYPEDQDQGMVTVLGSTLVEVKPTLHPQRKSLPLSEKGSFTDVTG
jgi:hypothetical protein